jgi:hypothetical protein
MSHLSGFPTNRDLFSYQLCRGSPIESEQRWVREKIHDPALKGGDEAILPCLVLPLLPVHLICFCNLSQI